VRIRRAVAADAAALHALAAATFPLACPPDSTAADQRAFIDAHLSADAFRRYLADPDRALFIGESVEGPAGYTMIVLGEPADLDVDAVVHARPTAELSKCYALPAAHGTGLAADLVHASIEEARVRGAVSMWLGVNNENARAQRFYEKQGFERVGTKRFRVGERVELDFVYVRPI